MNLQDLEAQLEQAEQEWETDDVEHQFKGILQSYRGPDEVISFQKYKELHKDFKKEGFSSGMSPVDTMIEGFHKGDLITVTAPTGMGKTSFCQFITSNLAKIDKKSLWFSYEVPVMKFLDKFGPEIPEGYVPKVLNDKKMVWIERKVVEGMVKFGVEVVFIDHLHYLFDMDARSPSLEIGNIMRELKRMALKYNITIFIIAHTVKIGEDEVVTLNSIRDSSFIGQESDFVFALWRVREKQKKTEMLEQGIQYTNETMISLVKNRYTGRLGSFKTIYREEDNTYLMPLSS